MSARIKSTSCILNLIVNFILDHIQIDILTINSSGILVIACPICASQQHSLGKIRDTNRSSSVIPRVALFPKVLWDVDRKGNSMGVVR